MAECNALLMRCRRKATVCSNPTSSANRTLTLILSGKYIVLAKRKVLSMAGSSGLSKPMALSAELEAVVGKGPMARSEVTKQLWAYIKANNLQDPTNKRNINADAKLMAVFGGKATVNMFEMTKLVSAHLS